MGSGAVVGYCGVVEERAGRSRWSAISGLSFVFGGLLSCEGSEAPGEFIWRGGEARLDGVVGDVTAMVGEAVRVVHSMIGEAALPHFAGVAGFAFEAKGESAFDKLHCLLDG